MAFYLAPGAYIREKDLSTIIPAVSTSVGVLAIRQSYKGPEYEKFLAATSDDIVETFGYPTTNSYQDILSGIGFLRYATSLYCTRVMPKDATFAGTKSVSGYDPTFEDFSDPYTFEVTGTNDDYSYTSLGTTDTKNFPEQVSTSLASDEPFWFVASSRGAWGNDVRVLVYDRDLYNSIIYYDENNDVVNLPDGVTVSAEASGAASQMYTDYQNNPSFGEDGHDDSLGYPVIIDLDTPLDSNYHFVVVVQAKDQGETIWETKEIFTVSMKENDVDDQGNSMFVETVINEQSNYLRVAANPTYTSDSTVDNGRIKIGTRSFQKLAGGYNGVFGRHDDTTELQGENAAVIEAYNLYSNPEEIDVNLFIDSGKGEEVKRRLITLCETIRKDSFAVLDIPKDKVLNNRGNESTDVVNWRKGIKGSSFNPNTSYAALYGNWLEVFDRWNKKYRWIPASGYVSGLYANTDQVADAWWAPAGLNRAVLTGVRRLAYNPEQADLELLYKNGVNPIVSFAGQGKVVWGQKTLLSRTSAFNRVNVRRLFLVLEKAISTAAKYFLFEQNDEVTWLLMRNAIEPFLRDVQGRRGITDFFVQIDENTNTPARIDRNELWGNIFIKPTRSAEFIVLNFIATQTGANFQELAEALAA